MSPVNDPTPESPSPKTQLPVNVPPPHRTALIVSIVAIILLVSIGLTIYQLKQKNVDGKKTQIFPTPTKTIIQQPTPAPQVESAVVPPDWKTYQDPNKQYALNYPPDFSIQNYKEGTYAGIQLTSIGPTQKASGRTETSLLDGISIKTLIIPLAKTADAQQLKDLAEQQQKLDETEESEVLAFGKGIVSGNIAYWYYMRGPVYTRVYFASVSQGALRIVGQYSSDPTTEEEYKELVEQIIATITTSTTDAEKLLIDSWLQQNNLNQYGDPKDTMYAGGTPLFDERTGERVNRYEYILKKYPERPWNNQ